MLVSFVCVFGGVFPLRHCIRMSGSGVVALCSFGFGFVVFHASLLNVVLCLLLLVALLFVGCIYLGAFPFFYYVMYFSGMFVLYILYVWYLLRYGGCLFWWCLFF